MRQFVTLLVIALVVACLAAVKPLLNSSRGDRAPEAQVAQVPQDEHHAHDGHDHSEHAGHDHSEHDGHDHAAAAPAPEIDAYAAHTGSETGATPTAPPKKMTPAECAAYCTKLMREKGMEGQCPEELCKTNQCPMHEYVVANPSEADAS